MKKLTIVLLLLLFLTGCSTPAWETVSDSLTDQPVSWLTDVYTIETSLPQGVELLAQTDGWSVYSNQDGTMEVETRVFPASDLTSAVKVLSGYEVDRLNILQTERFDMPEYQFAWVTQTECGQRLSRADIVIDDTNCYAVVCSTLEQSGNMYAEDVRQVIASFGLYTDEGV